MPDSKKAIKDKYPLPAYNFRVTLLTVPKIIAINKLSEMVGAESVGFSQVSGLELQYEPVVYEHGLSFATGPIIMSGKSKPLNITLRRGIIRNGDGMYNWLILNQLPMFGRRDILIDLCDETGLPKVRWIVYQAMPTKLSAPNFNADDNQVAIETLELIAPSMSIQYLDEGMFSVATAPLEKAGLI